MRSQALTRLPFRDAMQRAAPSLAEESGHTVLQLVWFGGVLALSIKLITAAIFAASPSADSMLLKCWHKRKIPLVVPSKHSYSIQQDDVSMLRITLIGAGSLVFATKLIGDMLSFDELSDSEITLMDIDKDDSG